MSNYDDFAETFARSRRHLHWPEVETIIADIQSQFGTQESIAVADIGCGSGRFLEELMKRDWSELHMNYLGVDASEKILSECHQIDIRTGFDAKWIHADMSKMNLEGSFDVVVFLASFHHLEIEEVRIQTLKNLKQHLTPKSRVYMTNWNLLSEENQQKYGESETGGYPDGSKDFQIKIGAHKRFYHGFTHESLYKIFEASGYEVLEHGFSDSQRNLVSIVQVGIS